MSKLRKLSIQRFVYGLAYCLGIPIYINVPLQFNLANSNCLQWKALAWWVFTFPVLMFIIAKCMSTEEKYKLEKERS